MPERTLTPAPFGRRLIGLLVGLVLFGASLALVVDAGLGLSPWDVFHQGVSESFDIPMGAVLIGTAFAVLALWVPLRERPGIGTIANAIVVGLAFEATQAVSPEPDGLVARIGLLVAGIVGNGIASGLYIGAGLGPGPRDGLMTGLARRGWSVRLVRTVIEVTVLAVGWILGGTVGIGTLVFAVGIGPLIQIFLPRFEALFAASD